MKLKAYVAEALWDMAPHLFPEVTPDPFMHWDATNPKACAIALIKR
jgi:hypothetical protein